MPNKITVLDIVVPSCYLGVALTAISGDAGISTSGERIPSLIIAVFFRIKFFNLVVRFTSIA